VQLCPEEALSLVRRSEETANLIPADSDEWRQRRAAARGIDLSKVL
jgi:hypothetical protein